MADRPTDPQWPTDLQFTTAESTDQPAGGIQGCAACGEPITSDFFAIGHLIACPRCAGKINAPPQGSKLGRLFIASVFGLGAGLIGAAIWFAIRRAAHFELGLIAILVGFMVGKAVRKGSENQGGLAYQILAVVITYCCIAANYMPDVVEAIVQAAKEPPAQVAGTDFEKPAAAEAGAEADQPREPATGEVVEELDAPVSIGGFVLATIVLLIVAFVVSLAAPFLAGIENLIGLLIIGIALWEAWRFNAKRPLPISGPYQIAPRSNHQVQ